MKESDINSMMKMKMKKCIYYKKQLFSECAEISGINNTEREKIDKLVLQDAHHVPSVGYLGVGKTYDKIVSIIGQGEVEATKPIVKIDREKWIDRMKRLDALRDLVAKFIDDTQEKQENRYNKKNRDVRFFVGDLVMRRAHVLSNAAQRFSAKLAPKYESPYKIL